MKKTFTVANIGQVDSMGDIFSSGCLISHDKPVFLSRNFNIADQMGLVEKIEETESAIIATAEIPDYRFVRL